MQLSYLRSCAITLPPPSPHNPPPFPPSPPKHDWATRQPPPLTSRLPRVAKGAPLVPAWACCRRAVPEGPRRPADKLTVNSPHNRRQSPTSGADLQPLYTELTSSRRRPMSLAAVRLEPSHLRRAREVEAAAAGREVDRAGGVCQDQLQVGTRRRHWRRTVRPSIADRMDSDPRSDGRGPADNRESGTSRTKKSRRH